MSNVRIQGNASGTGTLTLQAPNTNTDRTLNIPDNAGNFLTTGSAGSIIQVVQATTSTLVAVSTTTFTDTTLSASITPSSSSNKILVHVLQEFVALRGTGTGMGMGIRLLRDSTTVWAPIQNSTGPYHWYTNASEIDGYASINFLDSPSTTSSVTYKTQGRPYTTAGTVSFQYASGVTVSPVSTIILMEVVA